MENAVIEKLDQANAELRAALPQFPALTRACLDEIDGWGGFLDAARPPYLLGRGPSLASVYEGALLFHEVAKSPAVAMPTASFRHGPVEVVDKSFQAFVFAASGGTRSLNLALAQDIARFGGSVRVVGHPTDDGAASWSKIPSTGESLAPLFEIVPLQAAALWMAGMRDVVPGSFRYTPQVSTDEASFTAR